MRKLLALALAMATMAAFGHCAFAQKPAVKTVKLKVPPLPPSTDEYLVAQLAGARWMPAQKLDAHLPAGAEVALIGADPVSTGATIYLRLKPGSKLPPHWHLHLTWATMVAGKGAWTIAGKRVPATPGTFVIVPSRAKHELTCDAGAACVFVVRRSGPTEYHWGAK
jgi:quercetin dioxygenase-like cupin family protein